MQEEYELDFKMIALTAIAIAVVAVGATLALLKFVPALRDVAQPELVTFDVLKYTNAQRVVASSLISPNSREDATLILREVSAKTRETIREIAGDNTVVVVKQAVVQGHTRDITDEVLKRLGLPTDVPSISVTDDSFIGIGPREPNTGPELKGKSSATKALLP